MDDWVKALRTNIVIFAALKRHEPSRGGVGAAHSSTPCNCCHCVVVSRFGPFCGAVNACGAAAACDKYWSALSVVIVTVFMILRSRVQWQVINPKDCESWYVVIITTPRKMTRPFSPLKSVSQSNICAVVAPHSRFWSVLASSKCHSPLSPAPLALHTCHTLV